MSFDLSDGSRLSFELNKTRLLVKQLQGNGELNGSLTIPLADVKILVEKIQSLASLLGILKR